MSDSFTAVYSDGELLISGRRHPAGSLAVLALNIPKTTVSALEALNRRREDERDEKRLERLVSSIDLVSSTAERIPVSECAELVDDVICFRVYIKRFLSLGLVNKGAEDYYAFSTEHASMSAQLRREDNLRRTVLGLDINASVSFSVDSGRLCERLRFGSIRELLLFDFLRAMEHSRTPRACHCCGEFFVPSRSGEVYCTGEAPDGDGKSCREIGARRRFAEKLSGNDILRLYRAACGRVYSRKSRGGISAAEALEMTSLCTELRDRALSGEITIDQLGEGLIRATRKRPKPTA